MVRSEERSELDLRLVRFMEKGGDSGPAIVKGAGFEESPLLKLVSSGDMPPGEARVPPEKIELFRTLAVGRRADRASRTRIDRTGVPLSVEDRQYWAYNRSPRRLCPRPANMRMHSRCARHRCWLQAAMPEGLSFSPEAPRQKTNHAGVLRFDRLAPTEANWIAG